jgi:hypothetical protein
MLADEVREAVEKELQIESFEKRFKEELPFLVIHDEKSLWLVPNTQHKMHKEKINDH